jgi:PST family polysaccharide transporter
MSVAERAPSPGDRPAPPLQARAVQGMMWLGGQRLGVRILDQIFTIVMVRLLAPRDFGLLALAAVVSGALSILAPTSFGGAVVQRQDVDDEYLSTAFWANVAAGVTLFTLATIVSRFYGALVREPLAASIVVALAFRYIIESTGATQAALLSRRLQYRALALRPLFGTVAGGSVGVWMAYSGRGVWSLVGQTLVTSAVGMIALHIAGGWRPKFRFSMQKFRDIWSFGGPLILSRLFGYLVRNMDNFFIGRFLGSVALGYYALAYSVFLVPAVDIGFPISQVVFTTLSRVQDDADRLKQGFMMATRYVTMLILPMMVGMAIVAPVFVEVLFGQKWLPSAPIMSILGLAGFLQLMSSLGPSGLQAVGRTDLQMRWAFYSVLLFLPAFVIGLNWGITGVATGYLIASAILAPIQWRFVGRVIGFTVRELGIAVQPAVLGCAIMTAALIPARLVLTSVGLPKIVALLVLILLGAGLYGGSLWVTRRQDLMRLVRLIAEMRRRAPGSGRRRPTGAAPDADMGEPARAQES